MSLDNVVNNFEASMAQNVEEFDENQKQKQNIINQPIPWSSIVGSKQNIELEMQTSKPKVKIKYDEFNYGYKFILQDKRFYLPCKLINILQNKYKKQDIYNNIVYDMSEEEKNMKIKKIKIHIDKNNVKNRKYFYTGKIRNDFNKIKRYVVDDLPLFEQIFHNNFASNLIFKCTCGATSGLTRGHSPIPWIVGGSNTVFNIDSKKINIIPQCEQCNKGDSSYVNIYELDLNKICDIYLVQLIKYDIIDTDDVAKVFKNNDYIIDLYYCLYKLHKSRISIIENIYNRIDDL